MQSRLSRILSAVTALAIVPVMNATSIVLSKSDTYYVGSFLTAYNGGNAAANIGHLVEMAPSSSEGTYLGGDYFKRSANVAGVLPATGAVTGSDPFAYSGEFSIAGTQYVLASYNTFSWVWYVSGAATSASFAPSSPSYLVTRFNTTVQDTPANELPPSSFVNSSNVQSSEPDDLYFHGVPDHTSTLGLLSGVLLGLWAVRRRKISSR